LIGLLNAYHFDLTPGSYQETYEPMARKYLERVLPGLELKTYVVAQGEFPLSIEECDGWIITGSPASAYDDRPWVKQLIEFVQKCHQNNRKVLGICFGHQLVAQALGGRVEKSNRGWGIGVRRFSVLKNKSWMQPELSADCRLLFSHQDQVTLLPQGAEHLAEDEFCPFQMFSVGDHIFCMQGHPEFSKPYAQSRYDSRKDRLGESVYNEGLRSMSLSTSEDTVGQWIFNFFER
jgi:GMP synthase-like glutamine amidotransferase